MFLRRIARSEGERKYPAQELKVLENIQYIYLLRFHDFAKSRWVSVLLVTSPACNHLWGPPTTTRASHLHQLSNLWQGHGLRGAYPYPRGSYPADLFGASLAWSFFGLVLGSAQVRPG